MALTTNDWVTFQAGTYNVPLVTWLEEYLDPNLIGPGVINATRSNGVGQELQAGFILDPAVTGAGVFSTGGTMGQGMRETAGVVAEPPSLASFQLRFRISPSAAFGPYTTSVEIGWVPESAPANFSNAVAPWSRNETSLGTFDVSVSATAITSLNVTLTTDQLFTMRSTVIQRSGWSGRLAFSVREPAISSDDGVIIRNVGVTPLFARVTSVPFFNGLLGGPYGGKARFVRDGRFGMPALAHQLVRDGDNPGLWVRAEDFDPEDEPATYRPRRGEGTVDDEVGNG